MGMTGLAPGLVMLSEAQRSPRFGAQPSYQGTFTC